MLRRVTPIAAALLLAGCGTGVAATAPTWVPQPTFNGENAPRVQLPGPNGGPTQTSPAPTTGQPPTQPSQAPSSTKPSDPNVMATDLAAPIGIAVLPDSTALVGERATGRILHVQKQPGQPVQVVRTLPGIDASGDGGLLDLALSPSYGEDGLIYAYVTTATDNRVLQFTQTGPVTTVLTGIPKAVTGNAGRLLFGAGGQLYVGTGDAGNPAAAADPASLAGKILRITDIGRPAPGNPNPSSPLFSSGYRNVNGLCADSTGRVFAVQDSPDAISLVTAGGTQQPFAAMPADRAGGGGCAVVNRTMYIASRDGQALVYERLTGSATAPQLSGVSVALDKQYGRLRTVVLAPDGALWLTTSNKDGAGTPKPGDEKVLRIQPPSSGSADSPV